MASSNKSLMTTLLPSNTSSHNVTMTTQGSVTTTPAGSHVLAYVLVPLGSLALVAVLAFIVVMIFRKNKLDKLRHHLMPMYNFDPQEEEDWEAELLDDRGRRVIFRDKSPSPTSPKLKFRT